MKGSNLSTLCSKEKRKQKIISKDRKKAGGTISTKVRTVRREGILGREKKKSRRICILYRFPSDHCIDYLATLPPSSFFFTPRKVVSSSALGLRSQPSDTVSEILSAATVSGGLIVSAC